MFKHGDPSLKLRIIDADQVPAAFNAISTILVAAKERGMGVTCTAWCADTRTAVSWMAFLQTLGIPSHRSDDETVKFAVSSDDMIGLDLPSKSTKRGVKI